MWHFYASIKGRTKIEEINGKFELAGIGKEINDFFTDIGPSLADQIPGSVLDMNFDFDGTYPQFDFQLATEGDVGKTQCH